jgi:peptidoglycan-associated lipoprotein
MRLRINREFALLSTIAVASMCSALAHAQAAPATERAARPEIALGYTYLHSNAPQGGCGCFNMNGGNAAIAWPLGSGKFALAGDVTISHAGTVSTSGDNLTLTAFTAGVRYLPPMKSRLFQPFGQVLLGLAHSSGTLVQKANPGAANAGAAFAGNFGGRLDLLVNPRFSIRLVEAGYLLTTFDNGTNNHQNNLRISTGMVFHF